MFAEKYCIDPEKMRDAIGIFTGSKLYDDRIIEEYETSATHFDKFIILVDIFKIINSCSNELMNSQNISEKNFWIYNKLMMNYTNAVYTLKECVNKYEPNLKNMYSNYMRDKIWFDFITHYRILMVHHTDIVDYYNPENNDLLICIEKEQNKVSRLISRNKRNKKNKSTNLENLYKILDKAKAYSYLFRNHDKQEHYLSVKNTLLQNASIEIQGLEILLVHHVFTKDILPRSNRLISLIKHSGTTYYYTVLVNEDTQSDCEPNYLLEDLYRRILITFGSNSDISLNMKEFFITNEYNYFYSTRSDLDMFIKIYTHIIDNA